MAMPRPRVLMLPFGCVIILTQNKLTAISKASMEIYTDPTDIDGLHAELYGRGNIITNAKNDDLDPGQTYVSKKIPAVIANATITVKNTHTAYKVENTLGAKKTTVKGLEFQKPMLAGYFYWLEKNAKLKSKFKPKPKSKPKPPKKK
jgi:hypothetical protein